MEDVWQTNRNQWKNSSKFSTPSGIGGHGGTRAAGIGGHRRRTISNRRRRRTSYPGVGGVIILVREEQAEKPLP